MMFFDGQKFKFTLSKAQGADESFGDNTGLFKRGDTVQIKWCNIPESHFSFGVLWKQVGPVKDHFLLM